MFSEGGRSGSADRPPVRLSERDRRAALVSFENIQDSHPIQVKSVNNNWDLIVYFIRNGRARRRSLQLETGRP